MNKKEIQLTISDYIPMYPLLEDNQLNYDLFRKKEFYDLQKENSFSNKKIPGKYWNAQKAIQRFLSPFTPYNELLLFGKPGAGKTCASIAMAELNKMDPLIRKPLLIIVPNETLVNQWKKEIAFTCTSGQYIPENYFSKEYGKRLTSLEKTIRLSKKLAPTYTITTTEKFRRDMDKLTDKQIHTIYSNTIIIIDEAHNLRIQTNVDKEKIDESQSRYETYHRVLHLLENTKILMLTGTPMVDRVEEIGALMNLLLPLDRQLPTKKTFDKMFIQRNQDKKDITIVDTTRLGEYLKGRVSYIGESGNFPKRVDIGKTNYTKYLKLFETPMSTIQAKGVIQAYKTDTQQGGQDLTLNRNSRQALSFVYYHNEKYLWGNEASDLLMESVETKISFEGKIVKFIKYRIRSEFKENIKKNLYIYSSKYATLIQMLRENPKEVMFCFTPLKTGAGGAQFLSAILELFGFSRFSGTAKTEMPRHALITGDESSEKQRQMIFKTMNSDKNKYGEYCRVLIGTMSISVGNNLTNVRKEFVISPYWNNSTTEQGIGRGIRPSSLLWLSGEDRKVEVYQMCSVSNIVRPKENLDIRMYRMSEDKDIGIRKMERQLKIYAWDCPIQYTRNQAVSTYNYSRNCDYSECEYKCFGIPVRQDDQGKYMYALEKDEIDYSTYLMYYSYDDLDQIKEDIKLFIRKYNKLDINELAEYLNIDTLKLLVLAIENLFETNEIVYNSLGLRGFLKKDQNVLYITENVNSHEYQDNWYMTFPYLNKKVSLNTIVEDMLLSTDMKKLNNVSFTNIPQAKKVIDEFHIETKIFFIEYLLSLDPETLNDDQKQLKQNLLEIMKDNIYYIDKQNILVHDLMKIKRDIPYVDANKGEYGSYRCMYEKDRLWIDCDRLRSDEIARRVAAKKDEKQEDIAKNPYQMFAIITETAFKIVDKLKEKPKDAKKDRRTIYRGKNCTAGWKKKELIELAGRMHLELDGLFSNDKDVENLSRKQIIDKLNVNKVENIPADLTKKQLLTLYAMTKMKNPAICQYLKKWFIDNNLVLYE